MCSRNPSLATRNPAARRGILLLVVLSMLTLFLMIGTTYIVTANHARKASKAMMKATEASNSSIDQGDLLNEVLSQILRDTNNPSSVFRFHSLLRDMYGNDAIMGSVDKSSWASVDPTNSDSLIANPTNGQIIQLTLNSNTTANQNVLTNQFGIAFTLKNLNNAYNGLVLTFLDGPVRGQSTRIVGFVADGTDSIFRIMTVRKANGQTLSDTEVTNLASARILINGRPFNGTGFGYSRIAAANSARLIASESLLGNVDSSDTSKYFPTALMPNSTFLNPQHLRVEDYLGSDTYSGATQQEVWDNLTSDQKSILQKLHFAGFGGSDESYDDTDFQNMLLARLPTNPEESVAVGTDLSNLILPSLHRPALINYWNAQNQLLIPKGSSSTEKIFNPHMLRKVMMRPSWIDHPNFTGSNPEFANLLATFQNPTDQAALEIAQQKLLSSMIRGPWDVDNDNDGYRDGIWVDFGAAVMMNSDGRLVKPMVSVLIVDMDGRLNLNTGGGSDVADLTNTLSSQEVAGVVQSSTLPRGLGYGPAEVSLKPLLSSDAMLERMLRGENEGTLVDPAGPVGGPVFKRRLAGKHGRLDRSDQMAGKPLAFDIAAQLKMQGMPWRAGELSNYVTPPDFKGRYGLGLNDLGQPVYEAAYDWPADSTPTQADVEKFLTIDTPYEVDLSLGASRGDNSEATDALFSVAELERILRPYDADASTLPSRIWDLNAGFTTSAGSSPNLSEVNKWRTSVTTESYDLPVPSVTLPAWMYAGPDKTAGNSDDFVEVMNMPVGSVTFADLLEYRIRLGLNVLDPIAFAALPNNDSKKIALRKAMAMLLPADLANGLRLDINRPFGNGRDDDNIGDDGYGVVDEPGEVEGPFWASGDTRLNSFAGANGQFRDAIDRDGDEVISDLERGIGDVNGDGDVNSLDLVLVHNLRRQMLARDLFMMALTLVDHYDMDTDDGKATTRQLAQWAINICDYRDPDNIQTAFEYDQNPFNADGWSVDGNLGAASTDNGKADRQVVWGAAQPQLLMTESLAWHDRRTTDTSLGVANNGEQNNDIHDTQFPDADYDQLYRPEGAFFLELYNPASQNPAANRDSLALDVAADVVGVNLGAFVVNPDATKPVSPVWRLSIHKTAAEIHKTMTWDPDHHKKSMQPNKGLPADRTVYFIRESDLGGNAADLRDLDLRDGAEFFSTEYLPVVRPGRYCVVGGGKEGDTKGYEKENPGEYVSMIGRRPGMGNRKSRAMILKPSQKRPTDLTANPKPMVRFRQAGAADDGEEVTPPTESELETAGYTRQGSNDARIISDVAVINRAFYNGAAEDRSLTITEPAKGYTRLGYDRNGGEPDRKIGWYGRGGQQNPIDTPLDDNRIDGEIRLQLPSPEVAQENGGPVNASRVINCFSWIYLQRLANPMLPFDKDTNPYMTVDTISANATVFNGEVKEEKRWPFSYDEKVTEKPQDLGLTLLEYSNDLASSHFTSVQRGYTAKEKNSSPNIWALELPNTAPKAGEMAGMVEVPRNRMGRAGNGRGAANSHNMNVIVDHTLGFINRTFVNKANSPNEQAAFGNAIATDEQYKPQEPFPWLNWNNRPFANIKELMLVPMVRSSQAQRMYSSIATTGKMEKYSGPASYWPADNALEKIAVDGAFSHLPNFFRHGEDMTNKTAVVGLYRIFNYLQVPSRFVGTETWLNPMSFGDTTTALASVNDPRYALQPPFNKISSYREPGLMNLNTANKTAYEGLMHGATSPGVSGNTHPGAVWKDFVISRRGFWKKEPAGPGPRAAGSTGLQLNRYYPTFFANPFRSAGAGDLVPIDYMRRTDLDCTLLRSTDGTGEAAPKSIGEPLFAANTTNDYNKSDSNPYFRYQPMSRLSSMTTNRSNVYAIWITVGFFEVESAPLLNDFIADNNIDPTISVSNAQWKALYQQVYPEGYQLGKESGSDTGNIRRVREFAVLDRSIPVAFEPGQSHNSEKAVRLRRRID